MYNTIYTKYLDDRVQVKAYDNNTYYVRNTRKSLETANTLGRLNDEIQKFISRLEQEYDDEFLPMIKRISKRYNPKTLNEGAINSNYTSYTLNKGESITLCVRTRDENDHLYNDNILFGVLIHELAHVGSITINHGPEFITNFHYLLKKATKWNMFTRILEPFDYCGIETTI